MADAIITQAAIEKSQDNLTIVIVSFQNLDNFLKERPAVSVLEQHLFQIKEVESAANTSLQQTPALTDTMKSSFIDSKTNLNN